MKSQQDKSDASKETSTGVVQTVRTVCVPLAGLGFTVFVNFALLCSFRYGFVPSVVNQSPIGGIFFIGLCLFSTMMAIACRKFALHHSIEPIDKNDEESNGGKIDEASCNHRGETSLNRSLKEFFLPEDRPRTVLYVVTLLLWMIILVLILYDLPRCAHHTNEGQGGLAFMLFIFIVIFAILLTLLFLRCCSRISDDTIKVKGDKSRFCSTLSIVLFAAGSILIALCFFLFSGCYFSGGLFRELKLGDQYLSTDWCEKVTGTVGDGKTVVVIGAGMSGIGMFI